MDFFRLTYFSDLSFLDIKLFGKFWKVDNGVLVSGIHALSEALEII